MPWCKAKQANFNFSFTKEIVKATFSFFLFPSNQYSDCMTLKSLATGANWRGIVSSQLSRSSLKSRRSRRWGEIELRWVVQSHVPSWRATTINHFPLFSISHFCLLPDYLPSWHWTATDSGLSERWTVQFVALTLAAVNSPDWCTSTSY